MPASLNLIDADPLERDLKRWWTQAIEMCDLTAAEDLTDPTFALVHARQTGKRDALSDVLDMLAVHCELAANGQ